MNNLPDSKSLYITDALKFLKMKLVEFMTRDKSLV